MTNRTAGYIISAVLLCAAIASCSIFKKRISHDPAPVTIKVNKTEKPASPVYKKSEAEILADSLVAYAKTQIGVKYRYGGSGPSGFDCSGLVVFSFSHFGIFVPRTSSAQYSSSERISASEIRTGDLVFFNGSHAGGTNVGHVAIITEVLGEGKFKMIHATTQRGVCIDSFPEGSYYPPRLVGYGRVLR